MDLSGWFVLVSSCLVVMCLLVFVLPAWCLGDGGHRLLSQSVFFSCEVSNKANLSLTSPGFIVIWLIFVHVRLKNLRCFGSTNWIGDVHTKIYSVKSFYHARKI